MIVVGYLTNKSEQNDIKKIQIVVFFCNIGYTVEVVNNDKQTFICILYR